MNVRVATLLAAALCLSTTAGISGQSGFNLITPTAGELVPAGQPITVTWTGGDPSWDANLVLIDQGIFTVVQGFGVLPNSGSRVVTIPATEGPFGTCGREFRFYVENSPRTTWIYGPVFTVVCRQTVGIDIKPGSFPNSINLGSNGATPVAILGSATLNVDDIDVSTLTLGTAGVKTVGKTDRANCNVSDVSGDFSGGPEGAPDGFPDLVCHFVTLNIVPEAGGTTAKVMGELIGGLAIEGTDSVHIVP
jgi:hypothetical protein